MKLVSKQLMSSLSLVLLASACGGNDTNTSGAATFSDAISTVSGALNDISKLNPVTSAIQSRNQMGILAGFGSAWDTGTVRLPDASDTDLSIKEYMGKQLNPSAVGVGEDDREFAINVFGRFNNAMMIGCALMTVGNIDTSNGYPIDGEMTISMTPANLATMVEKCGMSAADAAAMTMDPALEITSVVSVPSNTTYYDKKIVMTLPAAMGGATQHFYIRFNSTEINIYDAEDGSSFDSRTIVSMNLATEVLKVEYYSGGTGNLYFHRLYYDRANDIGKMATFYGSASNYAKYTLVGKPNSGGTFALGFQSDQAVNYNGQACVAVSDGSLSPDDSLLACTLEGTAVADATAISDALARVGDVDWVTPSETITNTYTVDTIFTAVSP